MTYLKKTVTQKKNPGQLSRPGLTAGVYAHAVGFRKGEMNRPQCDESK